MVTGLPADSHRTADRLALSQLPTTDWQESVVHSAYGAAALRQNVSLNTTGARDGAATAPARQEIRINGGNREGTGILMVPDGYDRNKRYPLVVAIHNYNGSAADFATMIDAERLRKEGNIVFLPDAEDKAWMGDGIDYFGTKKGANGKPVDDVAFIKSGIRQIEDRYNVDRNDITVATFSQGGSLGWRLSSQMDRSPQDLGRVRNFVSAALDPDGRNGFMIDGLPGTNIVQYEPGYNGIQIVGNALNGGPAVAEFLPKVIDAKGAVLTSDTRGNGLEQKRYKAPDGSTVTFIYENSGEHAWPGQPSSYDSWIFGAGSTSHVRLTDWVSQLSAAGRTPSTNFQWR